MSNNFEPSEGFIAQTAQDYDMSVWKTKEIIMKDPENMYENLEAYLKERANSDY